MTKAVISAMLASAALAVKSTDYYYQPDTKPRTTTTQSPHTTHTTTQSPLTTHTTTQSPLTTHTTTPTLSLQRTLTQTPTRTARQTLTRTLLMPPPRC